MKLGKQKDHVNKNFTSTAIKKQYTKVFKIIDETVSLIPGTQTLNLPNMGTPKSKELPKIKRIDIIFEIKTEKPKSGEEIIENILETHKRDKITMIQNKKSKNETREYFICNDFDYIRTTIYELVLEKFQN